MSNLSEQALNIELGNRLADMLPSFSKIETERTKVLAKNAGKAPDIVIIATGRSPVIIEAEYSPARDVEADAKERLGHRILHEQHPIEAVIALRYPKGFEFVKNLDKGLAQTDKLEYCAVYPEGKRFPTTGRLKGSVSDLADLIHLVDVPETAFLETADSLIHVIDSTNSYFLSLPMRIINKIFKLLGLTEDPKNKDLSKLKREKEKKAQAGRMSGAIIANALLFHERIANNREEEDIPLIQFLFCQYGKSPKQEALKAWQKILDINYWPIFDAAHKIY